METKKYLIYRNQRYRFSLKIPVWWKKHCFLDQRNLFGDAVYTLNVNLRYTKAYQGQTSTNIFSIAVFPMSKSEWMKKYQDSPVQFIAQHKGKVFAAIQPGEPPEEFLNQKKDDYDRRIKELRWWLYMENVEVGLILKSFKFF